jgi:hypothetical protein
MSYFDQFVISCDERQIETLSSDVRIFVHAEAPEVKVSMINLKAVRTPTHSSDADWKTINILDPIKSKSWSN